MAHPTSGPVFVSKITPEDHGAKIVLCGALILPPITMMAALTIYNRARSKTLSQVDGLFTLCGTVLAVATFATFVHAKNLGLGRHVSALTDEELESIKNTVLAAVLLFFMSQGFIMTAYNVLIRKTARSKRFFRSVDALSAIVVIWSIVNLVLAGMSLSAQTSPPRSFLVGSAALTICIWMGQLSSFLWIVWSTSARFPVKIRWSISIGLFIPACLCAIITRLTLLSPDLFASDWTFTSVNLILAFTCEILFSVMNLLAPSLPVFFDQTSTGGLHYVPGAKTLRTTQFSSSGHSQTAGGARADQGSRAKSGIESRIREENDLVELSKGGGMFSTSIRRQEERGRKSFDSDAILVRKSVDIR